MTQGHIDHMPDFAFRMMSAVMAIEDLVHPTIDKRVVTLRKVEASRFWRVAEETRDHLKCLPI